MRNEIAVIKPALYIFSVVNKCNISRVRVETTQNVGVSNNNKNWETESSNEGSNFISMWRSRSASWNLLKVEQIGFTYFCTMIQINPKKNIPYDTINQNIAPTYWDGGHEQLISNEGSSKPVFAKRDKEQTMTDLRVSSTNWFENQYLRKAFYKITGSDFTITSTQS